MKSVKAKHIVPTARTLHLEVPFFTNIPSLSGRELVVRLTYGFDLTSFTSFRIKFHHSARSESENYPFLREPGDGSGPIGSEVESKTFHHPISH